MWLAFYNASVGDVLMLVQNEIPAEDRQVEHLDQLTLIKDKTNGEIVAANLFSVEDLKIEQNGPVQLTPAQVAEVNQRLKEAQVDLTIEVDSSSKFVVGYVETCRPHEDSDHLSITEIDLGQESSVQIVCGADNIRQGLKVLVAKIGAVMPSGSIIWPGQLRGVDSNGMVCSTRELNLTDIEDFPGIWELSDHFEPGTPLEDFVAYYRD